MCDMHVICIYHVLNTQKNWIVKLIAVPIYFENYHILHSKTYQIHNMVSRASRYQIYDSPTFDQVDSLATAAEMSEYMALSRVDEKEFDQKKFERHEQKFYAQIARRNTDLFGAGLRELIPTATDEQILDLIETTNDMFYKVAKKSTLSRQMEIVTEMGNSFHNMHPIPPTDRTKMVWFWCSQTLV